MKTNQESSSRTPLLTQKGSWVGRLVVRVLGPSMDEDYHSRKPTCGIDPSQVFSGTGPLHFRPWALPEAPPIQTQTPDKMKTEEKPTTFKACSVVGEGTNSSVAASRTIIDLYLFETCNVNQTFQVQEIHMNRDAEEEMNKTLKRLELSILKKIKSVEISNNKKSKKKGKGKVKPTTSSQLWRKPRDMSSPTSYPQCLEQYEPCHDAVAQKPNASVWQHDTDTEYAVSVSIDLSQGEEATLIRIPIQVEICPPTLVTVQTFEYFEQKLFVGVPLVVECSVMYAKHAIVEWYVSGIRVCHDNPCYTPAQQDVGKHVVVVITPIRKNHNGQGCEEAYTFKNRVEVFPPNAILSPLRHGWIQSRSTQSSPLLRVLSFNVLADQNAYPRDPSVVSNIYPWCELKYLDRKRRLPLIVHEILAYQADVVSLQEVDMFAFESLFRPVLTAKGYQGYYSVKKTGSTGEGCAMFWSLQCFEPVTNAEMKTFVIRDLFPQPQQSMSNNNQASQTDENDGWKSRMDAIADLLHQHENLRHVIQTKLGHVLLVTTLTLKKEKVLQDERTPDKITIANTHLFFHPDAGHIRVMQLLVSCRLLDQIRQDDGTKKKRPFVFCGDFNSTLDSGGCTLMFERSVPPNHDSWSNLQSFVWERDLRMVNAPNVNHDDSKDVYIPTISFPNEFPRLCSGYGDVLPQFTHYIVGFQDTLDYILTSAPSSTEEYGFKPYKWAPMPTEQDITKHVAMPNAFMPSDHTSLVCDLEFSRSV